MDKSKKKTEWIIIGVLGTVIFVSVIFALALFNNYEVIDKGQLLSYTPGLIYKIRFFNSFSIFIEPDYRLSGDAFNSYLLTGISFISLTYAFLVASIGKYGITSRVFWMYVIMAVGMSYLALDEFSGIHESIGHNMQFLASLPFVSHPDDVVILSYMIPVAIFLYIYRSEFLAARGALIATVGVVVFLVVATLSDLLTLPFMLEELSEMASSGCLVISVLLLGFSHVRELLTKGN